MCLHLWLLTVLFHRSKINGELTTDSAAACAPAEVSIIWSSVGGLGGRHGCSEHHVRQSQHSCWHDDSCWMLCVGRSCWWLNYSCTTRKWLTAFSAVFFVSINRTPRTLDETTVYCACIYWNDIWVCACEDTLLLSEYPFVFGQTCRHVHLYFWGNMIKLYIYVSFVVVRGKEWR